MSKTTQIFVTPVDCAALLQGIEGRTNLQFVQVGWSQSALPVMYARALELPRLGIASKNSSVNCDAYLVSTEGLQIVPREIPSVSKFAFDQLLNPKTITFQPCGLFHDDIIIGGSIGTASDDPDSLALMRLFNVEVKRLFSNIRGIYVGPDALRLGKEGRRLAVAEQSPREYDLAL